MSFVDGSNPSGDPGTNVPTQGNQDDPTQVFLAVGDRAFKDASSVAKHIEHSQNHIKTLEEEREADRNKLAEIEKELERLRKVEEGVRAGESGNDPEPTTGQSNEDLAKQAAEIALGLIDSKNTESKQKANISEAEKLAKEQFGEKYKEKVLERAKELGLTPEAVDAMAAESVPAFQRLFLSDTKKPPASPSSGNVTAPPGTDGERQPRNVLKMNERDRRSYIHNLITGG